ncbi:MAG: head maturation protease, ClpP-related [Candidatus Methylomirabilales bacterium]
MASPVKAAPREWYRITMQADASVAEIWVYDFIGEDPWTGEGVSAKKFLDELKALPESVKTLRVHVNSPGGSVFDAVAIANMLRAQSTERGRTVEMLIEALAASAASIITSAGDSIKIASNAMVMIHNPSGLVWGEAKDMRSMADALDSIRDAIVATYRWVSQLSAEAVQALMDATTWMDAEEAVKNGFATEIIEPAAVTAAFDPRSLKALGEIPEQYRERVAALTAKAEAKVAPESPAPADPAAVLAACREVGCLDLAEELLASKATPEQVTARVQQEQVTRKAEADRQTEIRGLCAAAKLPELAEGYITSRMPVVEVKTHLTTITAKMDMVEIDTKLPADGHVPAKPKAALNPSAIYAERRARVGQKGA